MSLPSTQSALERTPGLMSTKTAFKERTGPPEANHRVGAGQAPATTRGR